MCSLFRIYLFILRVLYFFDIFNWFYSFLWLALLIILGYLLSQPKYDLFWENIRILREDFASLEKELATKHFLLAYDVYIIIIYVVSILIFSLYPSMFTLFLVIICGFVMLCFYFMREYFVIKDNLLKNRFNFKSKHLLNNDPSLIKRFIGSYLFKKAVWVCYNCAKVLIPVAPTLLYMGPKVVNGRDFRPPAANFGAYRFTHLYHQSETVYGLAMKLYLKDPLVGPLIATKEGLIIPRQPVEITLQREFGLNEEQIQELRKKIFVTMDLLTDEKLKVKLYEEIKLLTSKP